MTTRVDPFQVIANARSKEVTARLENLDVGMCPICKTQMENAVAGDLPVYVCMAHRVCLPTQN